MEKRPSFFVSLRLTFEEKARLQTDAADMPVSKYMRWQLFDPGNPPPRRRGKAPVKDQKASAQAIGLLGKSGLAPLDWRGIWSV